MSAAIRPNILFIMTDQQRGDCLGVDGHPHLLTPNLDELAGGGTLFRRAYSTCPSCIPARRALLTGKYPSRNGLCGFLDGVPIRSATLPGLLRDAGYQTALVGRTMHQFPRSARYGYETLDLASGYEMDGYHRNLRTATDQVDGLASHGLDFNGWTARPWHLDETLHPTNYVVNQSLKFLENRDETCPFFLTVSFYAPHPPLCPPAFYMDRYLRQDLSSPTIGDWAVPPPGGNIGRSVSAPRVELKGEALRSCQAGYYGMINHLDDQIARLISGRWNRTIDWKNTVVVFTSDHGEMLGDHYYFRKCEPYEGSARIPLIVSGGEDTGLREGQVLDHPACLEDLLPTLLDLAGIESPEDVDGHSLLPLLRGEQPEWRPYLHGEHSACYSEAQAHHYLVGEGTKYIWRPTDGSEQLFDLARDPGEVRDLAGDLAHKERLLQWRARLIKELDGRPEGFTNGETLIAGRPYSGRCE